MRNRLLSTFVSDTIVIEPLKNDTFRIVMGTINIISNRFLEIYNK